jgi:hypothetical protein
MLRPAFLVFVCSLVLSLIPLGWFVQASNVGPRFIVVFHPMIYLMALGALLTLAQQYNQGRAGGRRGCPGERCWAPGWGPCSSGRGTLPCR